MIQWKYYLIIYILKYVYIFRIAKSNWGKGEVEPSNSPQVSPLGFQRNQHIITYLHRSNGFIKYKAINIRRNIIERIISITQPDVTKFADHM